MEAHPNFKAQYPLSTKLGLHPITTGKDMRNFSGIVQHGGFDIDEVETALGALRFAFFMSGVKEVFSVGHRIWAADHVEKHKRNAEVHGIYAHDLEAFLAGGH